MQVSDFGRLLFIYNSLIFNIAKKVLVVKCLIFICQFFLGGEQDVNKKDYWNDFYAYYRSVLSLSPTNGAYVPSKNEVEGEKRFWRSHRALSRQRHLYLQKSKFRK